MIFTFFVLILHCFSLKAQGTLAAYYPFNGNANDSSGNNNNGIVQGATLSADRFGRPDHAYYFDGIDDYILVSNSASLNPTNAITICAWYKSIDFSGNGYSPIVDKGYTSHVSPYYQFKLGVSESLYPSSGASAFGFSTAINNVQTNVTSSGNYWLPGNWYFLVGVYNGSQLMLYVNSQLIQTINVSGVLSNYNTDMIIGNNTTSNDFLKGDVDDVRIYNRALELSEITALYNETTNVEDQERDNFNVHAYPNPSNGTLTLSSYAAEPEMVSIQVFNELGNIIYEEFKEKFQGDYNNIIDISGYSNGIYCVKMFTENSLTVKKVLLVK